MPTNYRATMKRLQLAINEKFGARLIINKTQFYSIETERPISIYIIKQTLYNPENGRKTYVELFSSSSEVQCVLWLRDYWYELNGWEVPTDNRRWLAEKQKYYEKQQTVEKEKPARSGKK